VRVGRGLPAGCVINERNCHKLPLAFVTHDTYGGTLLRTLGGRKMGLAEELWQRKAACKGPQSAMFFPPSHFERKEDKERRERSAKTICAQCSVKASCLDYAIEIREPHGIWGGLNENERRVLLARAAS
jgi:WhiB family transcriptional regulator, redox-sensing transcriptional regulator